MGLQPGISDEAVLAKTGKNWKSWFDILDAASAIKMSHKEMVAYLAEHYTVEPWWQQSIVVNYEKARGLRQLHEKPDGFQVSRSKTLAAPVEVLFASWHEDEQRRQWLPDHGLTIRRQTLNKSIRATWIDGHTTLDINFYAKQSGKTQVTVQHSLLRDAKEAEQMKEYWTSALNHLATFLGL